MVTSDDVRSLRVAYVTPYDEDYASIYAHTARRISAWRSNGATVSYFTIGGGGRAKRGAAQNLLADVRTESALAAAITAFAPDVIYVRWLAPVPGLNQRLAAIAPVVLEIHADDLVEVARASWLRRTYLRAFRAQELGRATGATFVISELADDPSFTKITGARGVFGNGSWVQRRDHAPAGRPRVGISTAGLNEWTGLDRFVGLAHELDSVADWVVVCPELERPAIVAAVGDAVTVIGTASHDEYVAEVASWSVAIGTLALERKGLRTASPLKVRDYLGLGVPTVLPYWDEGVVGIEHELLLKLTSPTDAPIERVDAAVLKEFIAMAHGRDLPPDVSAHASGEAIERRRIEFLGAFRDHR